MTLFCVGQDVLRICPTATFIGGFGLALLLQMPAVSVQKMLRHLLLIFLSFWTVCCPLAHADENANKKITDSALRETRDIISRELFGHYDIVNLEVLKIENPPEVMSLGYDYGLVKVTLEFSAKRNTTKHPDLNRDMFEPGHAMCQGWLYLHCGVPIGHVFAGKLEVLLAVDREGSWRVVSPQWRSITQYPLHSYLLLEGREKEGYVLFPK
jgi:4-amino-4-deoxy-L-arabinose transferase-like glycosyltransferase